MVYYDEHCTIWLRESERASADGSAREMANSGRCQARRKRMHNVCGL